jgi:hypothetical protein
MKEAAHLIRLLGLLLAGAVLFAVVRQQVVPAGFGKYGHFRAGALDDVRARPIVHAGRAACVVCHEDQAKVLTRSRHARIGCESCHGPAARHADDPTASKPALPDTGVLCARCHEANSARPKFVPQVISKEHAGGEACKTCHQPHSPKLGG